MRAAVPDATTGSSGRTTRSQRVWPRDDHLPQHQRLGDEIAGASARSEHLQAGGTTDGDHGRDNRRDENLEARRQWPELAGERHPRQSDSQLHASHHATFPSSEGDFSAPSTRRADSGAFERNDRGRLELSGPAHRRGARISHGTLGRHTLPGRAVVSARRRLRRFARLGHGSLSG